MFARFCERVDLAMARYTGPFRALEGYRRKNYRKPEGVTSYTDGMDGTDWRARGTSGPTTSMTAHRTRPHLIQQSQLLLGRVQSVRCHGSRWGWNKGAFSILLGPRLGTCGFGGGCADSRLILASALQTDSGLNRSVNQGAAAASLKGGSVDDGSSLTSPVY